MPSLRVDLTEEELQSFKKYCKSKGLKQTQMLRHLINHVSSNQGDKKEQPNEAKSNQIKIRLSQRQCDLVDQLIKQHGIESRTKLVQTIVLSFLEKDQVFTTDEMIELRLARNHLASIGRNLNQIARSYNADFEEGMNFTKDFSIQLSNGFKEYREKIERLIAVNANRWREK